MTNRFPFDDHGRHQYLQQHQRQQQASFTNSALLGLLLSILVYLAYSLLTDAGASSDHLGRYLHGLHEFASRATMGLVKRPLAYEGSGGTAVTSVLGLRNAGALRNLGTDTIQRSIGSIRSIVTTANSETPAGLGNWDNSCYQNSVIQGLASLRSFPIFLRQVSAHDEAADMNRALLDTVDKLKDVGNNGKQLWLPPSLKTMSTFQQQDAQEYFSKILDVVDKEAVRVSKLLTIGTSRMDSDDSAGSSKDFIGRKGAVLSNPLEGLLAQRVGCKSCGHSDGLSMIPFNCLTVPLGQHSCYDIRECLDEYTKLEEIQGVQCPKCTLLTFRAKLKGMLARASGSLEDQISARLSAVNEALGDSDFSDEAITKKCQIPKKQWVESTKTKQAVVARAPQSLVIHVNRSMFNEYTGAQLKNPAAVQFPRSFGLGDWMIGSLQNEEGSLERWSMEPEASMLPDHDAQSDGRYGGPSNAEYELKAVLTHFGRHENGHYVCYRRHPALADEMNTKSGGGNETNNDNDTQDSSWWRLSDDDVSKVEEEFVLRQGGVFMLFYERIHAAAPSMPAEHYIEAAIPAPVTEQALLELEVAAATPLPAEETETDEIETDETETDEAQKDDTKESRPPSMVSPDSNPSAAKQFIRKQLPTPPPNSVTDTEDERDPTFGHEGSLPQRSLSPTQAIRMRTASLFKDDKRSRSQDSLLSPRMVSAL